MIEFSLRSPAVPSDVLAALQAHGGAWRESHIPDDLRRAGISGVECQIRETVATLRYWPGPTDRLFWQLRLELRATVTADAAGGTRVDGRVRYRPLPPAAFVGLGLFAAGGAWMFAGSPLAFVAPVMAAGLLVFNVLLVRESNAGLLSRERASAYLIERLESAVGAAGEPHINAPAS